MPGTELAPRNVLVPYSGEVLSLDSPSADLAALLADVKDLESRLRELKGEVGQEVHARMDFERKWTMRAGDYVLTGKSDALEFEWDGDRLAAVLTEMVDEGKIPTDAMDAAIEPVTGWKVKKAGLNALRKNPKLAEAIDSCGEAKPPEGRRVSVKRAGA